MKDKFVVLSKGGESFILELDEANDECEGEGVILVSDEECAGCEDNANARHTCGRKDCCDGTGWTGNPRERCLDHYEPHGLEEFGFIGVV